MVASGPDGHKSEDRIIYSIKSKILKRTGKALSCGLSGENCFWWALKKHALPPLTCFYISYTIIYKMTRKNFPQIPGYTIKEKLGEGGMAEVYLALQENLNRETAIKVLDLVLLKDEQILKRFKNEAQTAAKLVHPNIVTVYDVGQSGDNHYIIMEYLKESLRDRLKSNNTLPPAEALRIIIKIADALFYAHDKGIIHRDIKPDNIMFRTDGTPVLVDFGIARALDFNTRLTITGVSVGTPHYMSPEQCRGETIDTRSDIYSLGIVLFELLTGNVPFKSETPTGLIYLHAHGPIPQLPEELNKFQPLIDRMMAKQKEERITSRDEFIELVESLGEDVPVFYSTGNLTTERTIGRKINWPWILLLMAAILALPVYFFILEPPKEKVETPEIKQKPDITQTAGTLQAVDTTVKQKNDIPKLESLVKEEQPLSQEEVKTPQIKKETDVKTTPEKKSQQPVRIPAEKTGEMEQVKLKEEIKEPPETSDVPETIKTAKAVIKTVNFVHLPREQITDMTNKIKRIEIPNLPDGVIVGGEIELLLSVNENGHLEINHLDDTQMRINKEGQKDIIKNRIITKLDEISFEPTKDETGAQIRVINWRHKFNLGTFRGKIILYQ